MYLLPYETHCGNLCGRVKTPRLELNLAVEPFGQEELNTVRWASQRSLEVCLLELIDDSLVTVCPGPKGRKFTICVARDFSVQYNPLEQKNQRS